MNSGNPSRRSILRAGAVAALGFSASPLLSFGQAAPGRGKKVLFFTRSADFPHSVVTRKSPDELAHAERIFKDLASKAGYDVTISKDGTLFDPERIGEWDAFAFYTTGVLTAEATSRPNNDKTPSMSPAGKAGLLKAIAEGKGFLGLHCASDTFHSRRRDEMLRAADAAEYVDPYIAMIGGEFTSHGSQQKSMIRVASTTFPGLQEMKDYEMLEEWYGLYNLDPGMHVILVQDTETMKNAQGQRERQYQRDPYPATWAKMHGKGRVFYTSMGHREDVWTNPLFETVLLSGLGWISGNSDATIPANLEQACPKLAAAMKKPL